MKEIPQESLNMSKNKHTRCCLPSSFIDFEWSVRCIWLLLFNPAPVSSFQWYAASSLKLTRHPIGSKLLKDYSKETAREVPRFMFFALSVHCGWSGRPGSLGTCFGFKSATFIQPSRLQICHSVQAKFLPRSVGDLSARGLWDRNADIIRSFINLFYTSG